mgnify:FL=1
MFITANPNGNNYLSPNININLIDNTVIQDDTRTNPELPRFNMLIPIVVERGITNTLEIYYPGEPNRFVIAHGEPNPQKNGFGPSIIYDVLNSGADVGVYVMNLRGEDATKANIIVSMKYRIEKDVPYTDDEGNPYYIKIDEYGNKILTTDPGLNLENTPVVRDVMYTKFVSNYVDGCIDWRDLHSAMNDMASDTEDENGYKTLPWFSVMYRGSTSYGNNMYFNMVPRVSDADGNVYYGITMYDGTNLVTTNQIISMDDNAGKRYGADYSIESGFNEAFPTARYMASEVTDQIVSLFNSHLYTLDEVLSGTDTLSSSFAKIDPFNCNTFGIVTEDSSIDTTASKAFQLQGGTDGEVNADELYAKFFRGEILKDITSLLRYRFSYIPDVGYNEETKKAIVDLVEKRCRCTTATLMVGGYTSFESAILQRTGDYFADMPDIRLLAKCQSPMRFDEFTRKTIVFPATYYDSIAMCNNIKSRGVPYFPHAGYNARWTGYLEDTMMYPSEDPTEVNQLAKARINTVMKDDAPGGYLSDQLMNINFESDQIEFNNELLISDMLYDTIHLIHVNHFTFNESEDVANLKAQVSEFINSKYQPYSASISVDVYRQGNVGRAKSTNIIDIVVNLKDIARYAQINLTLEA